MESRYRSSLPTAGLLPLHDPGQSLCSPVSVKDDLMYHTIRLLEVITRESCLVREPCKIINRPAPSPWTSAPKELSLIATDYCLRHPRSCRC